MEDTNTLREEFMKEYKIGDDIAEFYTNKFNQKLEEIEELLEKEKIEFDSSDTLVKKVFDSHNQALDVALQIIKNKKN